jgi:hypothetical protein
LIVKRHQNKLATNSNENKGWSYISHILRFEYELAWLEANRGKIDRVFHTDSFDIVLSRPSICESRLLRFTGVRCWSTTNSELWLEHGISGKSDGGIVMERMRHHLIICSGSIAYCVVAYPRLRELLLSPHLGKVLGNEYGSTGFEFSCLE